MDLNPFHYKLEELKALIIALLYLGFSLLVLIVTPPVGLEAATVALVGPIFLCIQVFTATESTPMDFQKALEALKGVAITFIGFFVAVPTSTSEQLSLVIVGLVGFIAILQARKGVVSQT